MLEEISSGTEEATTKKKLAEAKGVEIGEQSKIIAVEKKDAEDALAEALPALEAARLALDDLDKSDVTEIRYDTQIKSVLYEKKRHVFRILHCKVLDNINTSFYILTATRYEFPGPLQNLQSLFKWFANVLL